MAPVLVNPPVLSSYLQHPFALLGDSKLSLINQYDHVSILAMVDRMGIARLTLLQLSTIRSFDLDSCQTDRGGFTDHIEAPTVETRNSAISTRDDQCR